MPIFETTNAADDLSDDSESSGKIGFLACSCFSCPSLPALYVCSSNRSRSLAKRQRSQEPPVINTFALCSSRIQRCLCSHFFLQTNQLPFSKEVLCHKITKNLPMLENPCVKRGSVDRFALIHPPTHHNLFFIELKKKHPPTTMVQTTFSSFAVARAGPCVIVGKSDFAFRNQNFPFQSICSFFPRSFF